jgi:cell division septation protein DedD
MTATSRRSRNYKERNSMFAFGHFALPIAALVAVGLLFVGIKLFFLTPSGNGTGTEVPIEGPGGSDFAAVSFDEFEDESPDLTFAALPDETPPELPKTPAVGPIVEPIDTVPSGVKPPAPVTPVKPAKPVKPAAVKKTPAAMTTAQKQEKKPAQTPSGTGWAVQVGAFSKAEGASIVMGEMKKMGYAASVSKSETSGSTFHRVRVSAGKSREEAQRLASLLEKKGYPVLVVPAR